MLKLLLARYLLLFFSSCSFIGLAHAYSEPATDPLQVFRDEIKQSETNASQSVLDSLKADPQPNLTNQQNRAAPKPSAAMPTPRANNTENSAQSANKNPWLQTNPWANQPPNIWQKNAKVNPYANAPIPGPTPPNVSASNTPSPPNIFAPSRQPSNPNKQRPNANS
ncbi:MAG: hypothetical protein WAL30_05915 [Candidatus Aquirickettsiella sp.]